MPYKMTDTCNNFSDSAKENRVQAEIVSERKRNGSYASSPINSDLTSLTKSENDKSNVYLIYYGGKTSRSQYKFKLKISIKSITRDFDITDVTDLNDCSGVKVAGIDVMSNCTVDISATGPSVILNVTPKYIGYYDYDVTLLESNIENVSTIYPNSTDNTTTQ